MISSFGSFTSLGIFVQAFLEPFIADYRDCLCDKRLHIIGIYVDGHLIFVLSLLQNCPIAVATKMLTPSPTRQHPLQPPPIQRRFNRIGQAIQIGFAAGGKVDRGAGFQPGPGQQGAEGGGVVEKAVAVGGENLPVGRDGAFGAAVGEVDGGMGQSGALGDAEVDFVAGHCRPAR